MHIFIRIKNEVQIPIVVTQLSCSYPCTSVIYSVARTEKNLLLKMYRGVCSYHVSNIYENIYENKYEINMKINMTIKMRINMKIKVN